MYCLRMIHVCFVPGSNVSELFVVDHFRDFLDTQFDGVI